MDTKKIRLQGSDYALAKLMQEQERALYQLVAQRSAVAQAACGETRLGKELNEMKK